MKGIFSYIEQHRLIKNVLKCFIITFGAVVYAVGFQLILFPNSIVSGGVSGIAMIINRLVGLPVGVLTIVLNLPLFLIAWKHFGSAFLLSSLAAMFLSSLCIDLFALVDYMVTDDMLLACIMGGILKGAGLGMIYYAGASSGGSDIVAKVVRKKYPHFNMGTLLLWLDVSVIAAYAVIFRLYESAMYAMVTIFVVNKVIDLVLYGFNTSVLCYIISDNSEKIVDEIVSGDLHRGVTLLNGEGAYTHREKQVIMCVVKHAQITEIRRLVRRIDDHAFVIVTDAKNVFGKGFESISESN